MSKHTEGPPIVTVPRDFSFCDDGGGGGDKASANTSNTNAEDNDGYPIYLAEDWDSGIGGGLWTTGLLLARYVTSSPHFLEQYQTMRHGQRNHRPVRVLELGSGNGFLGVCLVAAIAVAEANACQATEAAAAAAESSSPPAGCLWPNLEVVVTDTAEHLPLMQETVRSNLERLLPEVRRAAEAKGTRLPNARPLQDLVRVEEYVWGQETAYNFGGGRQRNDNHKETPPFDLIIGSDVAYRDHLHDPLIDALDEFFVDGHARNPTVALIGVTMTDTKPVFFHKLVRRNYRYEKLADHLLGDGSHGSSRQFGIFAVSRKPPRKSRSSRSTTTAEDAW